MRARRGWGTRCPRSLRSAPTEARARASAQACRCVCTRALWCVSHPGVCVFAPFAGGDAREDRHGREVRQCAHGPWYAAGEQEGCHSGLTK
eukprot:51275-Pleurochrysis_carterae.AAC.1